MKNIVWLASYPKSGNTWFRMFLANYLKDSQEPLSLHEIESTPIASNEQDFERFIGLNPFELRPDEVDLYRPDLYLQESQEAEETKELLFKKIHDAYTLNADGEPIFPEEVSKCAIYFVRNPMDVCVSYANHSASEIERTFNRLFDEKSSMAGKRRGQLRQILMSWKSHVKSWKDNTLFPVHVVRYEDMLLKSTETFGEIIRFLGLDYEQERLERAIRHSDFKLLQQMEQENGFQEKMQKCENFFWKGKIGNYHDYLSDEQVNRIVEYNNDVMKEFGYIDDAGKVTV